MKKTLSILLFSIITFSFIIMDYGWSGNMHAFTETTTENGEFNQKWKLKYKENFNTPLVINSEPWVRDPHGEQSPWNVDHLDDDGQYFQVQGGEAFHTQLTSFDLLRKRVKFGKDGWLTAELASRDYDKDGTPDSEATLTNKKLQRGNHSAELVSSFDSGIIIRSTENLPSQYRIEYTLRSIDFGGMRDGTFEYDGKYNGYELEGCKSSWPWKNRGDFSGQTNHCNSNFGDILNANGYYFLAIMDYENPAPHNNVFIHNHRKVGMDAYNTNASWAASYGVCDPSTKEIYNYTGPKSSYNGINAIFFAGDKFRDESIGYNQFMFETECGSIIPEESEYSIVSTAEIQPEIMPNETYKFAIERDESGYTMEMSGNFKYVGEKTLRYRRDFIQDGRPIWHYNNTEDEYNGDFNSTLTFSGPYGSYSVEQWPEDSAYPDNFIIGIPHINYYEGSAVIDDIRLYEPR